MATTTSSERGTTATPSEVAIDAILDADGSRPVAAAVVGIDALRNWLRQLNAPDRLTDPALVELLRQHGRLPSNASDLAIGQAASELIADAIERLRPPADAPRHRQLPFLLIKAVFVDRTKRYAVAGSLGLSERTVSRELDRALKLLEAELTVRRPRELGEHPAQPVPRIIDFVPRPAILAELEALHASNTLIHVDGPRGAGKTSLVAEYVSTLTRSHRVVWYQLRTGLNDSLPAFLLDLAGALRTNLPSGRADELAASLTQSDIRVASRLALQVLAEAPVLLVIDDYHLAEADPMLPAFVEEASARVGAFSAITISRRRERGQGVGAVYHMPQLTLEETAQLLIQLRLSPSDDLIDRVHRWTSGLPQFVKLAAGWIKTATPEEIAEGTSRFVEAEAVQEFLLDTLTDLIDPEDRLILRAASIFRDHFTDDALAFVAERSRGQILDTSRRLVRHYLATRSHDGEVAFFHAGVRDYVYARISDAERGHLHSRAALWYEGRRARVEARYHRQEAGTL